MGNEWTEQKIFNYYQEKFKPIYADLVAVRGEKPLEISFELEALLSHLGVAKTNIDDNIARDNYSKAGGHLQRASLDAAKMLWLEFASRLRPLLDDDLVRSCGTLLPEHEFLRRYQQAESAALSARKAEIENVGINPEQSVALYYDAAMEFRGLLDSVDMQRVKKIRKFRLIYHLKEHVVAFLIGLTTSALVAVLAWKLLPAVSVTPVNASPAEMKAGSEKK